MTETKQENIIRLVETVKNELYDAFDDLRRDSRMEGIRITSATMDHYINNYLMAIQGNLELLLKQDLPEDIKRKIQAAYRGTGSIQNILTDLRQIQKYKTVEYPGSAQILDFS